MPDSDSPSASFAWLTGSLPEPVPRPTLAEALPSVPTEQLRQIVLHCDSLLNSCSLDALPAPGDAETGSAIESLERRNVELVRLLESCSSREHSATARIAQLEQLVHAAEARTAQLEKTLELSARKHVLFVEFTSILY